MSKWQSKSISVFSWWHRVSWCVIMLPEFIWIQFKPAECVKCFRMVIPRGMLQWPSVWVRHVSRTSGIDSRTVSLGGLVVVVPGLHMFVMTGISICWHVGTHFTVLRGSFGRLGKPVASTLGSRRYWIDESRFTVDHNDGRIRVWRRRGERFHLQFVVAHNRLGAGSVMIWAGISSSTELTSMLSRET